MIMAAALFSLAGWLLGGVLQEEGAEPPRAPERKVLTAILPKQPKSTFESYAEVLATMPALVPAMGFKQPGLRKYAMDLALAEELLPQKKQRRYALSESLPMDDPRYEALQRRLYRVGMRAKVFGREELQGSDEWLEGAVDLDELLIEFLLNTSGGVPEQFVDDALLLRSLADGGVLAFVRKQFGESHAQRLLDRRGSLLPERPLADLLAELDEAANGDRWKLIGEIAERLATDDLDGAFDWAESLTETADQDCALDGIWSAKAEKLWELKPAEIAGLAEVYVRCSLAHSNNGGKFAAGISWHGAYEWKLAQADRDLAVNVFERMADEPAQREKLLRGIVIEWAASDGARAMEFAGGLADPKEREFAIFKAAMQWAAQQPEDVAEFVKQFPLGDVREEMLVEVVDQWMLVAPDAARGWVESLPPGDPDRDIAMSSIAAGLCDGFPSEAFEATSKIMNPQWRRDGYESALEEWIVVEPEAAAAALARVAGEIGEERAGELRQDIEYHRGFWELVERMTR